MIPAALHRLALLALLLLAFGLRTYRLDGQSLWYDEGVSAQMVHRNPPQILAAAAHDIHPPLYYLTLWAWAPLGGSGEFSLRFPSVAAGLTTVALLARLGQRLFGPGTGAAAALLLAVAPFHILYSQEARMYAPVAALALASFLLFDLLLAWAGPLRPRPWTLWAAWGAVTLASLLTQYFATLTLVTQNLIALLRHGLRARWSWWGLWLGTQAALGLLYLPWLALAQESIRSWPAISKPLPFPELVRRLFLMFAFGPAQKEAASSWAVALVVLLSLLGLVGLARSALQGAWRPALVGGGLLFGPLLLFALSTLQRPAYNPKFLLLAEPGFALLLALGLTLSSAGRAVRSLPARSSPSALLVVGLGLLGLGGLLYPTARGLDAYYHDPRYARDDYRGLVRWIEALSKPGDVILLNAPGQQEVFGYYYGGELTVVPLPQSRPPDRATTEAALAELTREARAIWSVRWATQDSDPEGIVEGWLQQHHYPAGGRWFGGVYLALYGGAGPISPGAQGLGRASSPLEDPTGPRLALGPAGALLLLQETQALMAVQGEILGAEFTWLQGQGAGGPPVSLFVHLVGEEGLLWGQRDAPLEAAHGWGSRLGVLVLPGTPPGSYRLVMGAYDPTTGVRYRTPDGRDYLSLATIELRRLQEPLSPEAMLPQQPRRLVLGLLRLLGFDLGLAGEDRPRTAFQPGETVHLNLYWRSLLPAPQGTEVAVELVDSGGTVVARFPSPVLERYPLQRWEPGELVLDQRRWVVQTPPGSYRLRVSVGSQAPVHLSTLTVASGASP